MAKNQKKDDLKQPEMARELAFDLGVEPRRAREFIDAFFEVLGETVIDQGYVAFYKFGKFELRWHTRHGRADIGSPPEKPLGTKVRRMRFRPAKELIARCQRDGGGGE